MQSSTIITDEFLNEYPIMITIPEDNKTYYCKEELVNQSTPPYSKLVSSENSVAIVLSPGYGSEWSAGYSKSAAQLVFDSRLIKYVASEEFATRFYNKYYDLSEEDKDFYNNLMKEWFPSIASPYIGGFVNLVVEFIPKNSVFRIVSYDGAESIEYYNPNKYLTA